MVEEKAKTRLVVVLGMHRSGTSAISSAIDELGMSFGDNLYGPREDNPAGFWENESLVQFNDALLLEFGMRWDSLGFINDDVWADSKWESWFGDAENLLREELSGASSFGMKDPRISKLLGFWHIVFQRYGYDVKYVVALRNPLEVIASLDKRDGFDSVKSQLLWLEYTISALLSTKNKERMLVSYNDLMDEPGRVINSLSKFLDDMFENKDRGKQVGAINSEYRHTKFTKDDLVNSPDALGLVTECYLAFLECSRTGCDESEFSTKLDKIVSCYRMLEILPQAYSEVLDKNEKLKEEISELRGRTRYQIFVDFVKGKVSL